MRHGRKSKRHARNVRRKARNKHNGRNYHHNLAKSRGGPDAKWNVILLDRKVHRDFHIVFGNRTLSEVIRLLQRLQRAKEHQRIYAVA